MFPELSRPSDQWTAWFRALGERRWRRVAAAPDEDECRRLLGAARLGSGDYLVLAPGKADPNSH